MKCIKSERAVSAVIATVVLVAVTISVAIAVSLWMSGIAGGYTKFEKVEVQSTSCTKTGTGSTGYWNITIKMKNTGTAAATLASVLVNDVEVDKYNQATYTAGQAVTSMTTSKTVESGDTTTVYVYISQTYKTLSSGTTVNIKVRSAGGMDYIKMIELV